MLDPLTGELIRASKATTVHYERERPGALTHMDVKKPGRIPDGGGRNAHGRTRESPKRAPDAKIRFDHMHSLVDDHSLLANSEILVDGKDPTYADFLERAIAYFAAHGIGRTERLITNNASAYRWSRREVCKYHRTLRTE